WLFGSGYLFVVRLLQLLAGCVTAWVCSRAARQIWGNTGGETTLAISLLLPTFIFFTAEILTESLAILLTTVFLYFLVQQHVGKRSSAVGIGLSSGLAMLLRFNAAFLPAIALWPLFRQRPRRLALKRAAIMVLVPFVLVLPWLVRNLKVFHGQVLVSSVVGVNALEGILTPQGRGQRGEQEAVEKKLGWSVQHIEWNPAKRATLPSEAQLNRQAIAAAKQSWRSAGWHALPVILAKLGYFWLSTDQLTSTWSFPAGQRLLRWS